MMMMIKLGSVCEIRVYILVDLIQFGQPNFENCGKLRDSIFCACAKTQIR